MSIVRRESRTAWPTPELAWPEERIDRVFREMWRDFFAGRALTDRFSEALASPMHVEEFMREGACIIRAEVPGIDPDKDVEITVGDGILTVLAHREERNDTDRPYGHRSEFHYGSFRRSIRLPQGADETSVRATYKDGILEISIPVGEPATAPTTVPVQRA